MKKYKFALLLTAFVTTGVFAQDPSEEVGKAVRVEGLVTVSQNNTLGNLVKDSTVVDGARVVATSTGAATIRLDNGCRIELTANQAITIDSRLECKALIAGIQSTGAGVGAVAAAAGGKAAIVPAFAAGALAIGLIGNRNNNNPPQNSSRS